MNHWRAPAIPIHQINPQILSAAATATPPNKKKIHSQMSHRRGKRDRPHPYSSSSSFKKLRRHDDAGGDDSTVSGAGDGGVGANPSSSSFVMVSGLPSDCSVLELKSRLEMYGAISRPASTPRTPRVTSPSAPLSPRPPPSPPPPSPSRIHQGNIV
ncbi:uncharacterized protein M6B38_326605 [Iris pallida]|uniref:Uncharacterized protein n=1 Tax=Iris pallida TaxID=29817 RepID=A0AAX6H7E8_IRIPA|nr:uncharacterized protein M6B38_326605 [Iris pallida]